MLNLSFVYHPIYSVPFPQKHRFRMEKFRLLHEHLQQYVENFQTISPKPITRNIIKAAHDEDYVDSFIDGKIDEKKLKKIGLPWSTGLRDRLFYSIGGTMLTTQLALKNGIACHLAGGTHHAHYDFGSGFCIFNDLAIAAIDLIEKGQADVIFILDCDVHHGDGTATVLESYPNIFTCSIHCSANFPIRKPNSDLDIALDVGIDDKGYLSSLQTAMDKIMEIEPDLVIYDAGVDVHKSDALGKLALTSSGISERDSLVLSTCIDNHIPIATVIGGGYDEDVHALAERHAIVHKEAIKHAQKI